MNQSAIFWPLIAQFVLVIVLYGLLSIRRKKAVAVGSIKVSQFRENLTEPTESLFVRNSLNNQFELPTLFYVVCIALFATSGVTTLAIVLAWIFVASRYIHAAVHVTTNRIRHRQPAFILGFLVLIGLWGVFAAHLLGGI